MTVLITGATSGIGEELAKRYLASGCFVIAIGRNQAKLAELKYFATSVDSSCDTFSVDIRDFEALQAVCKDIILTHPKIDLFIANAGISAPHNTDFPTIYDFKNILDTNLLSIHAALEIVLPAMKSNSTIALISSLASYVPLPTALAYATSKSALNFYADTLRNLVRAKNISVVSIRPGFIDTPLTKKNRFKMPFLMNKNQAADLIIKAILNKNRVYTFPFLFATAVKLFASLPCKFRDFLIYNLSKKYDKR